MEKELVCNASRGEIQLEHTFICKQCVLVKKK